MTSPRVLGVTMGRDQSPGSNVRGRASGAAWTFALPELAYGRVLCVGLPAPATLRGLQRVAQHLVLVAGPAARTALRLPRLRAELDPGRPAPTVLAPSQAPRSADLLVVTAGGARRHPGLVRALLAGHGDRPAYLEVTPAQVPAGGTPLRVTPVAGTARTASPAAHRTLHAQVSAMGLDGTVSHRGPLAAAEDALRRTVPVGPLRTGTRPAQLRGTGTQVPSYVRRAASGAGVDLAGAQWSVAARGEYDSQKVLLLVAPAGAPAATHLVKITRGPQHNARLDNEAAALAALDRLGSAGRCPSPWFCGAAADRSLLGQGLLPGRPFAAAATWTAGDPGMADALGWLADLAARTKARPEPGSVAAALTTVLRRWSAVYAPPASLLAPLRERLAVGLDDVPTVAQHGDPAFWNLVRLPDGTTGFLDWESYEPAGLPLWDAAHLLRSCAAESAVRAGVRSPAEAAGALVLPGAFRDRLDEVVRQGVEAGLPSTAAVPLLLGYLVHRSVKEAGQQPRARLERSASAVVLRRLLESPSLLRTWEAA